MPIKLIDYSLNLKLQLKQRRAHIIRDELEQEKSEA